MKQLLVTTGIVLLTLGGAVAHQGAKPAGADSPVAKALIDLENKWQTFSKANDGDGMATILADNFVMLDVDGTMRTKADVVERTKKAKWVTNEISDLKVTVHGDTGVVTGIWVGKGNDGAGKAIDSKERFVDSWAKMADGKWRCVASAAAPIK